MAMQFDTEFYRSAEWRQIAKDRMVIDDFKCVGCKGTNRLEVHHIVPPPRGPKRALSNLKTLCHDCHSKQHLHMFKNEQSKKQKTLNRQLKCWQ